MQTSEILKSLREKNNLTQDQMADRVMVSRQAVSRGHLRAQEHERPAPEQRKIPLPQDGAAQTDRAFEHGHSPGFHRH